MSSRMAATCFGSAGVDGVDPGDREALQRIGAGGEHLAVLGLERRRQERLPERLLLLLRIGPLQAQLVA